MGSANLRRSFSRAVLPSAEGVGILGVYRKGRLPGPLPLGAESPSHKHLTTGLAYNKFEIRCARGRGKSRRPGQPTHGAQRPGICELVGCAPPRIVSGPFETSRCRCSRNVRSVPAKNPFRASPCRARRNPPSCAECEPPLQPVPARRQGCELGTATNMRPAAVTTLATGRSVVFAEPVPLSPSLSSGISCHFSGWCGARVHPKPTLAIDHCH